MLEKSEGREILRQVFEEAGFAIREDVAGEEPAWGTLDGYDPERRVGYEYVTLCEPERLAALDRLNQEGRWRVFLVDEQLIGEPQELAQAAREFLRALE